MICKIEHYGTQGTYEPLSKNYQKQQVGKVLSERDDENEELKKQEEAEKGLFWQQKTSQQYLRNSNKI